MESIMKVLEINKSRDLSKQEEDVLITEGLNDWTLKNGSIVSRIRSIIPEKLIATIIRKSNEGTWSYSQIAKGYGLDMKGCWVKPMI